MGDVRQDTEVGIAAVLATGQAAVSNVSASKVAARSTRKWVLLKADEDNVVDVYVGIAGVATTDGFRLKPGAATVWDTSAAIHAVSASGAPVLSWVEGYD